MAKQKPKTPYQNLLDRCKEWAFSVQNPTMRLAWFYPKGKLMDGWALGDLYERVAAAAQLDYDVILKSEDRGLTVYYRKRPKTIPWEIAP